MREGKNPPWSSEIKHSKSVQSDACIMMCAPADVRHPCMYHFVFRRPEGQLGSRKRRKLKPVDTTESIEQSMGA